MQEINNRRETKQFTQNIETELRFNPESTWTCGFYSNTLLMIPHVDTNPLVHTSWVQWLLAISNSLKSTILFSNKPWSILLNVLTKLRFVLFFGISLWAIMFPRLGFIYCELSGTYQRQLFFFLSQIGHFFVNDIATTVLSASESVLKVLVTQLCPTFCEPMNCSPPGSSDNGILQARVLEWVAISFSRGSSWPRAWTQVSCIAGRFLTVWIFKGLCWASKVLKNDELGALYSFAHLSFSSHGWKWTVSWPQSHLRAWYLPYTTSSSLFRSRVLKSQKLTWDQWNSICLLDPGLAHLHMVLQMAGCW